MTVEDEQLLLTVIRNTNIRRQFLSCVSRRADLDALAALANDSSAATAATAASAVVIPNYVCNGILVSNRRLGIMYRNTKDRNDKFDAVQGPMPGDIVIPSDVVEEGRWIPIDVPRHGRKWLPIVLKGTKVFAPIETEEVRIVREKEEKEKRYAAASELLFTGFEHELCMNALEMLGENLSNASSWLTDYMGREAEAKRVIGEWKKEQEKKRKKNKISASNISLPFPGKPYKNGGLFNQFSAKQLTVDQYSRFKPAGGNGLQLRFSYMYTRPHEKGKSLIGADALTVLEKVWSEEGRTGFFMGSKTKTGFCLLYELATGQCDLQIVDQKVVSKLILHSKSFITKKEKATEENATEGENTQGETNNNVVPAVVKAEDFSMHKEAAEGLQQMVGNDWSVEDLQVLLAIHNGDNSAAATAILAGGDINEIKTKIKTRKTPPKPITRTTTTSSSSSSSPSEDFSMHKEAAEGLQQMVGTNWSVDELEILLAIHNGNGNNAATAILDGGDINEIKSNIEIRRNLKSKKKKETGETKNKNEVVYPEAVHQIFGAFPHYSLAEIFMVYCMKGNSVEQTSHLLAIDEKVSVMKRATQYQKKHGASNTNGSSMSDDQEGPRRMPLSGASLAWILTSSLTVKAVEADKLNDQFNLYPLSVLFPLSNAALEDVQSSRSVTEEKKQSRLLKFPLLPYERNQFYLTESESGMATFDTRHGHGYGGHTRHTPNNRPPHQGKEFTVAVLSACLGYVNEPNLGFHKLLKKIYTTKSYGGEYTLHPGYIFPSRPELNDCGQSSLLFTETEQIKPGISKVNSISLLEQIEMGESLQITKKELNAFSTSPLSTCDAYNTVKWEEHNSEGGESIAGTLPFDLSSNPASKNIPAQQMLSRMNDDLSVSQQSILESSKPKLNFFCEKDVNLLKTVLAQGGSFDGETGSPFDDNVSETICNTLEKLKQMIVNLELLLKTDMKDVREGIVEVVHSANRLNNKKENQNQNDKKNDQTNETKKSQTNTSNETKNNVNFNTNLKENDDEIIEFRFARLTGQRRPISFEFLTGALLSTTAHVDLHKLNPFLTRNNTKLLKQQVVGLLMRYTRSRQIGRCLNRARSLTSLLRNFLERGLITSARSITNNQRNTKTISSEMIKTALKDSNYHGKKAALILRKLVQNENELCLVEGKGKECSHGASVLFHLINFDVEKYNALLNQKGGLIFLKRISDLAKRSCYYSKKFFLFFQKKNFVSGVKYISTDSFPFVLLL